MRFPTFKPLNPPFAAAPASVAPMGLSGQVGSSTAPAFAICQVKNFCRRLAYEASQGISAGSIFAPVPAMAFAGGAGSAGATMFSSEDVDGRAPSRSSGMFAGLLGFPDNDPRDLSAPKKNLLERLKKLGHKDLALVSSALDNLSDLSADGQIRNLRCAFLLSSWNASAPAIAAALISGKEDYSISGKGELEAKNLLSQLSRIQSFTCNWSDENQPGYLISLLFAISNSHEELMLLAAQDAVDVELSSQRSSSLDRESKEKMLRSFFVTSWILKYFGFSQEGGVLEDAALLHLDPSAYKEVEDRLYTQIGMRRTEALSKLRNISREVGASLNAAGIGHDLKFRMKTTASAKVRHEKKGNNFDTNGIRIIINDDRDEMCYAALSAVRSYFNGRGWYEDPAFYDDYVRLPKANGYQSIHVYYRDAAGYLIEVQIRTSAMHRKAELGSAAHGAYKTGESVQLTTSSDVASPRNLFGAKRNGILSSGTFFVIDDSDGRILKIVTGSQGRKPSLLDAAFARSAFSGLYAENGFLEGSLAKLSSPIESGQRFDIQKGSSFAFAGRGKIAATPYAKAMISYAAKNAGSVDPRKMDMERLSARGKAELARISSEVEEELINSQGGKAFGTARPRLLFSLKRLYHRMGFETQEQFFTTLGAFSGISQQDFAEEAKSRIMANSILFTRSDRGGKVSAKLLLHHDSSLLKNILSSAFGHGLSFSSVKFERVGRSQQALLEFEMFRNNPAEADAFFSTLEDSYKDTLPPYLGGSTFINLTVRIAKNAKKSEAMQNVLEALFKNGMMIDECDLKDAPTGEYALYEMRIRVPNSAKKGRVARSIDSMMMGIKGVHGSYMH